MAREIFQHMYLALCIWNESAHINTYSQHWSPCIWVSTIRLYAWTASRSLLMANVSNIMMSTTCTAGLTLSPLIS